MFLFTSTRGFFHPLGWLDTPLENPSFADITPDKYYTLTLKDWCSMFLPKTDDTSIPPLATISSSPLTIFAGLPLKASRIALRAWFAFRKIDPPSK